MTGGELGFRFGSPLDMDGDGQADIAAGARFKLKDDLYQNGVATVWSGATGEKIREWDGPLNNGLFGHWVLPVPDLDGDKIADVVVGAPNSTVGGVLHGVVSARSPKTGEVLWRRIATRNETLGWDLAIAGDQDRDGVVDIYAGAPFRDGGCVYLLSGKDGSVMRSYQPEVPRWSFGWFVASTDDFDGDGYGDLAAGAFLGSKPNDNLGAVYLMSSQSGALIRRWDSTDPLSSFGEVVAAVGDLDGDGKGDIAISSPYSGDVRRVRPGEVQVFSAVTGAEIRHWTGRQDGEYYGRMVTSAGDVDGDAVDDIAIGAPWHRNGDLDKVGRAEIRSGKSGAVLAEWVGDKADGWLGWHIRRAPDPDNHNRPALLIGSLRYPADGATAVGIIDLWVKRRESGTGTE